MSTSKQSKMYIESTVFLLAICFSYVFQPTDTFSQEVTTKKPSSIIKIDTDRVIGDVDQKIYGNFAEHLGRCIYGGIYEPSSPIADEAGFRKDVIETSKNLNVTVLRWPGGNFVSGYHWIDGIGPKADRPKRIDLAWGAVESNQIGTDEFIKYCRKIGAEPYFCVNLGTGSWDEARNWVEYCNRSSGTYYSDLRRKNGSDKPYNVKYWGLGNELDGPWQMGHKNAEDYGKYALEAAKMMKWIDKDIKLIVSGSSDFSGDWIYWNRTVLDYLKDHTDYISLHTYLGNSANDYYNFLASTELIEKRINITRGLINETLDKTKRKSPIYIAFDEWNVWYRAGGDAGLEEKYNLEDALVVSSILNSFVRNADIVKMANLAQLVNVIAPIFVDPNGTMWLQTTYYPLQLFANNCSGKSLDIFVDCEKYDSAEFKGVPYLDTTCSYDVKKGEIVLNVVNRSKDKAIETGIFNQNGKFSGKADVFEVNGPDIKAMNNAKEKKVSILQKTMNLNGESFNYSFPAHSFTMIKIKQP